MTRFKARTRAELEDNEDSLFAPYAARSRRQNETRAHQEPEHAYRTNYQRDRDRIIHSRAFRRLKHKRQVFLVTTGDHYRTRLTHTIEVVQLSRTLARALGANEDLAEAAALGHDLGHTPFGHIGEVVIHQILKGKDDLDGLIKTGDIGGFKHNYQSVRVVDTLEKKYTFSGLNLTLLVREGILKHTRLLREHILYPEWPDEDLKMDAHQSRSIEGQIVAICDEIAQRTHDLEDGFRAGFVQLKDVRQLAIVELAERRAKFTKTPDLSDFHYSNILIKKLVDLLISDVVETTLNNIHAYEEKHGCVFPFDSQVVDFSRQIDPMQLELDRFITRRIIRRQGIEWHDEMAFDVIRHLFMAYIKQPDEMRLYPTVEFLTGAGQQPRPEPAVDEHEQGNRGLQPVHQRVRQIADFVAGMTDHFATKEYERLVGHIDWPKG